MKYVAESNGFTPDDEVKMLSFGNSTRIETYFEHNKNKTWYAVAWCTTE